MNTMQFHLGDILSVSTGLILSPDGVGGIYRILNYMTGDNLYTHQLPRASDECRPWIVRQLPFLSSPEMRAEVARLEADLATPNGKANPSGVVLEWLDDMTHQFGETHTVQPIPMDDHEKRDPVEELSEMAGVDKVIAVDMMNDLENGTT